MRDKIKLKNGTILEVGNSYLNRGWTEGEQVTITAIGDSRFLAHDEMGYEDDYYLDDDWLPYEEEKKEKWYEVLQAWDLDDDNNVLEYKRMYTTHQDFRDIDIILREWHSKEEMIKDLKNGRL